MAEPEAKPVVINVGELRARAMGDVVVRWSDNYGYLLVRDPWGEYHELSSKDAPRWMVHEAMDKKKRERLERREQERSA